MDPLTSGDPTLLGPFRLLGRLGAGGMGQVYLGRDGAGVLAAVKVIHPGLGDDPQFRRRFAREIATARAVRAPWTAVVLDADPDGPRPWLATEYVPGPSLHDTVTDRGPLQGPAVDELAARLAEAVAALHAGGIVHRDLKPSNVLLADDGPRLIDFGIARAGDSTRITHTGGVLGTPAFMSPEQAAGEHSGEPSDVFSLASVLTFAATGVGPFGRSAGPVAMLRVVCVAEPDLRAVPDALRAVLAPCLAKDPRRRPTAAQLAARLAQPSTRGPVGHRVGRRAVWLAAAAVLVAATLTAVLVVDGDPAPAATASTPPSAAALPSTVALVANRIPGWAAAASTSRNAAYDVPPSWTLRSPDFVRGVENVARDAWFDGVAVLRAGECPGEESSAWSGITGVAQPDTAAAARSVAEAWVGYFRSAAGPAPAGRIGDPVPVTIADGAQAGHVVTEVDVPSPDPCRSARAVIHTVAAPAADGGSVVWVLLADRGGSADPSDDDIGRMISTLRPAGLGALCDPARAAAGSWC